MILYGVCWREFLKEQIKDIIISSLDGEDFPRTLMRDSPDGTVESDRYRQETLDLAGGVLHPIPGLELSPLASHSGWGGPFCVMLAQCLVKNGRQVQRYQLVGRSAHNYN